MLVSNFSSQTPENSVILGKGLGDIVDRAGGNARFFKSRLPIPPASLPHDLGDPGNQLVAVPNPGIVG